MALSSRVLLDSSVLSPAPLADFLLRLAAGPKLYQPRWTAETLAQVTRFLPSSFDTTEEVAKYRESEMRLLFPEALVKDYEPLMPLLTIEPYFRQTLAAAIHCRADMIVTMSGADFPRKSVAPYAIQIMGPSEFLKGLSDLDIEGFTSTLRRQAEAVGQPVDYLIRRLGENVYNLNTFLDMGPPTART